MYLYFFTFIYNLNKIVNKSFIYNNFTYLITYFVYIYLPICIIYLFIHLCINLFSILYYLF